MMLPAGYSLVLDSPVEVARWVDSSVDILSDRPRNGRFQAIGLERKGKLVSGIVFDNYDGVGIEGTIRALPRGMIPEWCGAILHNVFTILGCWRMTGRTSEDNVACQHLLEKVGFKLEGRMRLGWDGKKDCLIYGILEGEARRWLDLIEK
jgi:RimJ/RimL family protein N-acetyltransferase